MEQILTVPDMANLSQADTQGTKGTIEIIYQDHCLYK